MIQASSFYSINLYLDVHVRSHNFWVEKTVRNTNIIDHLVTKALFEMFSPLVNFTKWYHMSHVSYVIICEPQITSIVLLAKQIMWCISSSSCTGIINHAVHFKNWVSQKTAIDNCRAFFWLRPTLKITCSGKIYSHTALPNLQLAMYVQYIVLDTDDALLMLFYVHV